MGPASQSRGTASRLAPRFWKMRVLLACGSAKPNWMPKAPRQMVLICQGDRWGLEGTRDVRWRTPAPQPRIRIQRSAKAVDEGPHEGSGVYREHCLRIRHIVRYHPCQPVGLDIDVQGLHLIGPAWRHQ